MKQVLLLLLLGISIQSIAQPANLIKSSNALSSSQLVKAKEAIDQAVKHPKTINKSKTWRLKGDVYYAILNSKNPIFRKLDPTPAHEAFTAYVKAKTLGKKGKGFVDEIDAKLKLLQNIALNKGVQNFNNKQYTQALNNFKVTESIANHFDKIDSLALFNIAIASERSDQYDQAVKYYKKSMDIGYREANCCSFIIYLLRKQEKDSEALEQIKMCRKKFPNNQELLTSQINLNLRNKDFKSARKNLKQAVLNDPKNATLHFSLGTVSENIGDRKQAIDSYLEALRLRPNYFDPNYNLGALYFNSGVEVNNKANNLTDKKKYESEIEKANLLFKKAIPYLEKARTIKPKDRVTLTSLKMLYGRLEYMDKYKEVKKALQD